MTTCPKSNCNGVIFKIDKDIVTGKNLICKKCGELFTEEELKRCCD